MLSRQTVTRVCLTRLGRIALLRTAAARKNRVEERPVGRELFEPVTDGLPNDTDPVTVTAGKSHVSKVEERRKVNLKGPVEPKLVEPVIDWLLDDTAEMPFIPVTATRKSNTPSWLPMRAFCGPFDKDRLVFLDPTIFNQPIRRDILHACITWYRDSIRSGTASTKTRSEVAGSGRKIRPQKGTGRARLGDAGSPMLRSGGRAFGPKPRDFSTELPKKVRELGLKVALSAKLRERKLIVVPSVDWPNWKTKWVASQLRGLCQRKEKGCLVVTGMGAIPKKLEQTTRNLNWVTCKTTQELQVWDVLKSTYIVLSLEALQWLQENLGNLDSRPDLSVPDGLRMHSMNAPAETEPEAIASP